MKGERAQTTLDFAIGASIFLLAVAFVFGFVPTMLDPFTSSEDGRLVLADRTAQHLADDALAESPARPSRLNSTCTAEFFAAADLTGSDDCGFTPSEETSSLLATGDYAVDVTIHELDTSPSDPVDFTFEDETISLHRGPESVGDNVVAHRVVLLEGTQYRLTVRVW
jgi:hypothetical protein